MTHAALLQRIDDRLTAIEAALQALQATAVADEYLTTAEAAQLLKKSVAAVRHLDIPRHKAGGNGGDKKTTTYYRRSDLVRYMEGRRIASSSELAQQAHNIITNQ